MRVQVIYLGAGGDEAAPPSEAEITRLAERYVLALLREAFPGVECCIRPGGSVNGGGSAAAASPERR